MDEARRDLRRALDFALGLGVASARDVAQAQRRIAAGDTPATADIATWLALPREAVESLLALARALPRQGPGDASAPTTGDTPTLAEPRGPALLSPPAPRPAGQVLGGYEILGECGRGGMGIVYRARQIELDRIVALKVLIAGEHATPVMLERFQREARAAARLRHPHLVEIYDVGREGEKHFFTMRYVDGAPLSDLIRRKEVPARRALEIVRKIALALDHAHREGVVHRDVKPSNIIVDACGEPHLTDFGLARDVADADITQPGTGVGTPSYAAPEQVSGERGPVDARSDVYALGATLYDALAGRPPFRGEHAWEVVFAVLSREPESLRKINRSIHRDIETICMKAMEKEPSRRYGTAGEMAEDVRRYLEGELILARPASLATRSFRRARRNPVVSLLSLALLGAGGFAAFVQWNGWEREREVEHARQAMVEGRLKELARSGKALVDAALARRAMGDLEGCARFARGLADPVHELIAADPGLAEPWHHRGRMEAALGEVEDAERSQDRAVELASRPDATAGSRAVLPFARYERGVLRASLYQLRFAKAREEMLREGAQGGSPGRVPDARQVDTAWPEIAALKRAAIDDLEAVARSGTEGLDARACAARGIREVLEGDARKEAAGLLERAIELDRYLTEAYLARALLSEESRDWQGAAGWYEKGIQADRGLFAHYERLARALQFAAEAAEAEGREGGPFRARAIAAIDAALALDGGRASLWNEKAEVAWWEAAAQVRDGIDPGPSCESAIEAAKRALSIDPASAEAEVTLGNVFSTRADWKVRVGQDPEEDYRLSAEANRRAIELDPDSAVAACNLASVHAERAERKLERREDPREECARAIEGFERALRVSPRFVAAANNLGNVHTTVADWKRDHEEDPVAEYEKALAAFDRALAIEPRHANAAANRGTAHQSIGEWRQAHGQDPTEEYERAREAYELARSINPRHAAVAINLPNLDASMGDWLRGQGKDPQAAYDRALAAYRGTMDAYPGAWQPRANFGLLLENLGRREEAIAAYEDALRVCPGQPQVTRLLERARGAR